MKKEILYYLSVKLRELREEKNLTQVELANTLNINRKTYTNWEIARTEISVDNLVMLANFYKVNIDYLFGLDEKKTIYHDVNYKLLSKRLNEYIKTEKIKIEALAIDAGTTISTIWVYLHNKVKIRTIYLYLICKNNNLSMDYLLGRVDNPKYLK